MIGRLARLDSVTPPACKVIDIQTGRQAGRCRNLLSSSEISLGSQKCIEVQGVTLYYSLVDEGEQDEIY